MKARYTVIISIFLSIFLFTSCGNESQLLDTIAKTLIEQDFTPISVLKEEEIEISKIELLLVSTKKYNEVRVSNYDEQEILKYLTTCKMKQVDIFAQDQSKNSDEALISINIQVGNDDFISIDLGFENRIYNSLYNPYEYEIINLDNVITDLLNILKLERNDDGYISTAEPFNHLLR